MPQPEYFTSQRIGVFVFIVLALATRDIIAVASGTIRSYDDEFDSFLIGVAVVFIACFRPKLFDKLTAAVIEIVGRVFGRK